MRGSGVSGKYQLWVSPGGSAPRDIGCSNSSLYFSSFPKASPPCSGLGSRHEARGSVAGSRASPARHGSGGRWRREGAARCLPLEPAACEWRQGCVSLAARFWMKSHQWAFLWNRLAMAGVKPQAWLSPFFCLPRLPTPPCALDAGGRCLCLPAPHPGLCACRQGRGRAKGTAWWLQGLVLLLTVPGSAEHRQRLHGREVLIWVRGANLEFF